MCNCEEMVSFTGFSCVSYQFVYFKSFSPLARPPAYWSFWWFFFKAAHLPDRARSEHRAASWVLKSQNSLTASKKTTVLWGGPVFPQLLFIRSRVRAQYPFIDIFQLVFFLWEAVKQNFKTSDFMWKISLPRLLNPKPGSRLNQLWYTGKVVSFC